VEGDDLEALTYSRTRTPRLEAGGAFLDAVVLPEEELNLRYMAMTRANAVSQRIHLARVSAHLHHGSAATQPAAHGEGSFELLSGLTTCPSNRGRSRVIAARLGHSSLEWHFKTSSRFLQPYLLE